MKDMNEVLYQKLLNDSSGEQHAIYMTKKILSNDKREWRKEPEQIVKKFEMEWTRQSQPY